MRSQTPGRHAQKGFTLIELIVVIGIIAILAAVLLASLLSVQKGARDSRRLSDINQIKAALVNFEANESRYPTTAEGVSLVGNSYLDPVPTAPASGPGGAQSYQYFQGDTGFVVCVQSERDTSKWFYATSTGIDRGQSAACDAGDGK